METRSFIERLKQAGHFNELSSYIQDDLIEMENKVNYDIHTEANSGIVSEMQEIEAIIDKYGNRFEFFNVVNDLYPICEYCCKSLVDLFKISQIFM